MGMIFTHNGENIELSSEGALDKLVVCGELYNLPDFKRDFYERFLGDYEKAEMQGYTAEASISTPTNGPLAGINAIKYSIQCDGEIIRKASCTVHGGGNAVMFSEFTGGCIYGDEVLRYTAYSGEVKKIASLKNGHGYSSYNDKGTEISFFRIDAGVRSYLQRHTDTPTIILCEKKISDSDDYSDSIEYSLKFVTEQMGLEDVEDKTFSTIPLSFSQYRRLEKGLKRKNSERFLKLVGMVAAKQDYENKGSLVRLGDGCNGMGNYELNPKLSKAMHFGLIVCTALEKGYKALHKHLGGIK